MFSLGKPDLNGWRSHVDVGPLYRIRVMYEVVSTKKHPDRCYCVGRTVAQFIDFSASANESENVRSTKFPILIN